MKKKCRMIVVGLCVLSVPLTTNPQERHWGTEIRTFRLENGLNLIHELDPSSKVTVVQIFIKGGKWAEPTGKAGLAYLTTRLVLEIPDQSKIQQMMDQATRIYTGCRQDYSYITLSCLSENFEDSLKLVAQIMRKPLFSGIRISRLKEQMERQGKTAGDDAPNLGHDTLMAAFFRNAPYAHPVFGNEESLKAIKKKDIEAFYRNLFHSSNLTAVVSSDLEADMVNSLFEEHYGSFQEGSPPELPSFESVEAPEGPLTKTKDTEQSLVSTGFIFDIHTPREYALGYLVDCLLGKGIQSRMWGLRMGERLAYSVQSRLTHAAQGSLLEAFLETDEAKTERAREALRAVIVGLHTEGIDAEELEMTKSYAQAEILRDNETKESRSFTFGYFQTMGLGYAFLDEIFSQIKGISLEEINSFIRTYLDPDKGLEVIIGPVDTIVQESD
jgi:predicted Zn-dependent peptidase